jgi:hypothetical protein
MKGQVGGARGYLQSSLFRAENWGEFPMLVCSIVSITIRINLRFSRTWEGKERLPLKSSFESFHDLIRRRVSFPYFPALNAFI